MSMDKFYDRFDFEPNGLTRALQRHRESVPADFTARVLRRLRQAQVQKILARVVLQKRLALAGCVIFSCIAVVAVRVFPEIAEVILRSIAKIVTYKGEILADRIPQTIRAFGSNWQSYTILALALGFAAYNIIELFRHENLKTI
ncbi:MAG: hypothetical protein A2173_06270 [Planctomycetes bacterium RBG_13_44_8b]|nr:MAG: hypothetical protein A2173_06270 [Planctomycetes bacterium RBG_13_44_8b]